MEQPFRATWNARKRLWNHLLGHAIPKKYRLKNEGRTGGRNLQIRKAISRSLREKGCGQSVGEVAFGTWVARLIAAPLNQRATKASALPKNQRFSGAPGFCAPHSSGALWGPREGGRRYYLLPMNNTKPQKSEIFGGPGIARSPFERS